MALEDSTSSAAFLETVEGEISFFRSVMRARPVGIHRHFHVLSIQNTIQKDTGRLVSTDDIWEKLKTCYDLDALEGLEIDGYDSASSNASTPVSIPSPSPSGNLASHPFFRDEYALPRDDYCEALISARRVRATASPTSSSRPPSPAQVQTRSSRKRGKSKLDMAGLVGGDSDSSALTQESGDEGSPSTQSAVSVTEGGTEEVDEEDAEMRDPSPVAHSPSAKTTRSKAPKVAKKTAPVGRTRATAGMSSRPAAKRRKR